MKKMTCLILVILVTAFYFCKESHEPLTPNQETRTPRYLSFTSNPCQGNPGELIKALYDKTILQQYSQNGDTLTLQIHYVANCCPAFVDSAAVSRGKIVISLADTMGFCDCMCEYDDDFKFLYNDKGDLNIIFQWWFLPSQQFTVDLDTTIQIY